jgi:SAM-dependent methyltransferase
MDRQLVRFYRTAEDYLRYAPGHAGRTRELSRFYQRYRRYFGRSVLDLACGGGILGRVLEPTHGTYVGVDANPDMLREARKALSGRSSDQRFLKGDISTVRIDGRFDTVTLLGNALGHLNVEEMDELVQRRRSNVHPGSTFLIEYRDIVEMFWKRVWARVYVQTHKRGKVISRTRSVDFLKGRIHIEAKPAQGRWTVEYTQALWSPFILDQVMRSGGWTAVFRSNDRRNAIRGKDAFRRVSIYRYQGT